LKNLSHNNIKSIFGRNTHICLGTELETSWNDLLIYHQKADIVKTFAASGIVVEDLFRVLFYLHSNNYKSEIKPLDFVKIIEKFKDKDSERFPDSIRLVVPELLESIYSVRSKFYALHRKRILPSFYDCIFILESLRWIILQFLRFFDSSNTEIEELYKIDFRNQVNKILEYIMKNIEHYKTSDVLILGLYYYQSLTHIEMVDFLNDKGKNGDKFMIRGFYNLTKNNLVVKSTKNKDNKSLYVLSSFGIQQVNSLLKSINLS